VLTVGPVAVFLIAVSALVVVFGISNSPGAPPGSGMNVDEVAAGITAALGLLTVITNVAVFYFSRWKYNLFLSAGRKRAQPRRRIMTRFSHLLQIFPALAPVGLGEPPRPTLAEGILSQADARQASSDYRS